MTCARARRQKRSSTRLTTAFQTEWKKAERRMRRRAVEVIEQSQISEKSPDPVAKSIDPLLRFEI
jgi:hypothetical protein